MQDYYDTVSVLGAAGQVLSGADPLSAIGTLAGIGIRRTMTKRSGRPSGARTVRRRVVSEGGMAIDEGVGETTGPLSTAPQGPLTQLTHSRHVYGKFIPLQISKKLALLGDEGMFIKYFCGTLSKDALANGTSNLSYQLRNREEGSISISKVGQSIPAVTGTEFPMHIWSLCNRNSEDNNRVTPTVNVVGHFCYSDSSANQPLLKFGPLVSVNQTGSGTCNDWNIWSSTSNPAVFHNKNQRFSILKDVTVDLLLQGSRVSPTTFHVELVKIHDHKYGPESEASHDRDNVYLPMIRKLLGNPIAAQPPARIQGNTISVLAKWQWYIAPGTNIDNDSTPAQKHVQLHINLNHRIKWNYTTNVAEVNRSEVDDVNRVTAVTMTSPSDEYDCVPPDYRDRLFLVVRATSANQQEAINAAVPQYDLRMKATHVYANNL